MAKRTRLLIWRSVFLLLALFPLVVSVSWATYRHVAIDSASYCRWIAAQTGLELKLRCVVHARPGVTRFEGLNIVDPENGDLIARCEAATVRCGRRATGIHFSTISIQPAQFRRLLELVHERVLRQQRLLSRPVYVVAESVALPGNGRELKLSELRLDAETTALGPEAMLTFRWAERPGSELVRLHLLRDHTGQPATTKIELLTGDTPLPCNLLARLPEPLTRLGDDMTFQGNLHLESTTGGWQGEAAGYLENLQLEHLTPIDQPPVATGKVRLKLRQASFQGSWMQSLAGRFEAGPGEIHRSLLSAFQDHLQMEVSPPERPSDDEDALWTYQQMALEFRLDRHAAVLLGACDSSTSGVVMMAPRGPLVRQSSNPMVAPISLVRAVFGLSHGEIPVSPESQPLLRVLPMGF